MLSRSVLSELGFSPGKGSVGEVRLRALLVVSLLPVSEINQRFRPGYGRTGGGLQAAATAA